MTTQEIATKLKSSFSVEGVPLIKTDRFTQEEVETILNETTCHKSHWNRMMPYAKTWSDEEILEQVESFMSLLLLDEKTVENKINILMTSLSFEDLESDKKFFSEALLTSMGIQGELKLNRYFWGSFGSAPFCIHGERLERLRDLYGACGMEELFGNQNAFSLRFHLMHAIANALQSFDTEWNELKQLHDKSKQAFLSPFDSVEQMLRNTLAIDIEEAAAVFYMDRTKPMSERVKAFNTYGKHCEYIAHPKNLLLADIFSIYYENDSLERYSTITCISVVDYWLENLANGRCHLNWSNHYHPKIDRTNRNYTVRQEAVQRLRKYYIEKLFIEGVSKFNLDW